MPLKLRIMPSVTKAYFSNEDIPYKKSVEYDIVLEIAYIKNVGGWQAVET